MEGLALVGAGFGRTGTLSLKTALEALGYGPCHHMMEVMKRPGSERAWRAAGEARERGDSYDWASLVTGYRACVDWPGCSFWRELSEVFPQAPVLLSVRDPDRWYESAHETIYQVILTARSSQDPAVRERMRMADALIFEGTFQGRFEDRSFAIGVFEEHIEAVKQAIPAERLLVYRVADGWGPLCSFLGVASPAEEFPHVNSRDEFRGLLRGAAGTGEARGPGGAGGSIDSRGRGL